MNHGKDHMKLRSRRTSLALALIAASFAFSPVYAQNHGGHDNGGRDNGGHGGFGRDGGGHDGGHDNFGRGNAPRMHMDGRYDHNHFYYDRGHVLHGPPRGGNEVFHGGHSYWYDRNHWYGRRGSRFVVIAAPIGAFVPFLPLYYSTIWWGGVPYYYANDTYYTWDGQQDEYQVVDPPSGIQNGGTTNAPSDDEVFIYPRNNQSTEQQAQDRYECHRSAVDHTGFDPTVNGGGVPAGSAATKRSDYMRAQAACLEARGYSVR
jgi:hypothetical protein